MTYDFDLFTIGAGSGGVRASRMAAGLGARVAVAESGAFGGTCVNVGCIPKKLFSYAAHFHEDFADAAGFGWHVAEPWFDWPTLVANKDREIARLNGIYERILTGAGVEVIRGRATVVDAHTVAVAGRTITAAHILVATGGYPTRPAIPGAELGIVSDDAFHLPELPERVLVYGGGYIAVEFASIFAGMGVQTTLVYRGERLLRHFDADLGETLAREMVKKGVKLVLGRGLTAIEQRDGELQASLTVAAGAPGERLHADCVMFATGRAPLSAQLGLQAVGVAMGPAGQVLVDDVYRTSVPSIFAIGDVTDRVQLTPVALAEGMVVADTLFGDGRRRLSYDNIATAVFSHPNVGTVGLSEERARKAGHTLKLFKSSFKALKHTVSGRDETTFMKLVVDAATDKVLGVHMVGPDAGELVQGFAVALNCGATKAQFDATIGIHPTAAEEFVTMRTPVA